MSESSAEEETEHVNYDSGDETREREMTGPRGDEAKHNYGNNEQRKTENLATERRGNA